ncbi:MAG TPA: M20 family metallopeptidase [Thermoanaerobaculia bacterium]|nr:M20 family metallopeptidase [Thermoanaerobaculia bacterium]
MSRPPEHVERALRLFDPELRRRLVELRRDIHRHPELSWQEERTAARLQAELERLAPAALARCAATGVIARIQGRNARAPVVAVRGDIDALPIGERTGLPYASVHPGVMHACGHDVHATWAVGAACLLRQEPAAGDVVVVLQPAEEVGEGAKAVLASGVLDEARAIFGAHVDRRFSVGEVVAQEGALAAAADDFTVEVRGLGGHAARPHLCRDPLVAAAEMVTALQTLVSRRIDPGAAAVLTVGTFAAGSAPNVIPEAARLSGTLRSLDPGVRSRLAEELRRVVRGVADAHHVEADVDVRLGSPPLWNSQRAVGWATAAIEDLLGKGSLVPLGPANMGGEDFACYLERIEGCFLRIGAREEGGEPTGAHQPTFHAAEEAIFVGAAVLAATARRASAELAAIG